MTDKTEAQINRGTRAEALLADPLFVEAREVIEAELYRLYSEAKPTATEELVQIKSMQYMHQKYQAFLKAAVNDGKLARLELERARKPGVVERILNR